MDSRGEWTPCERGELRGLVAGLRRRRERRAWRGTAIAGLLLAVSASALFWAVPSEQAAGARISCREVHNLAGEFAAGRLEEDKSAQIRRHLEHCRPCRKWIEQQEQGDAAVLEPPVPCPKQAAPGLPIASISP